MIDDQMDDYAPDAYAKASDSPGPVLPAHRLWEAMYARSGIEGECDAALIKTFGADPEKPDEWGFDDITYDPYDGSFELKGIVYLSWKPTPEQMAEAWRLGFDRCWLCYVNGLERYCDPSYGIGDLKPDIAAEMAVKALGKTKGKEPVDAKRKAANEAGHGAPDQAQGSGPSGVVAQKFWRRIWSRFLNRAHA